MRKMLMGIRPFKGARRNLWPPDSWNKQSMQYRDQMRRIRSGTTEEQVDAS